MSTPSIAPALPGIPAIAITPPELALRSLDATWDRARWESLPADGNRYEVIDGVLYTSTSPNITI